MLIRQYFTVKEDDRKPCFGQVATLSTNEAAILNESVEKALEVTGKRGKCRGAQKSSDTHAIYYDFCINMHIL